VGASALDDTMERDATSSDLHRGRSDRGRKQIETRQPVKLTISSIAKDDHERQKLSQQIKKKGGDGGIRERGGITLFEALRELVTGL